jgi:hypothetical protein
MAKILTERFGFRVTLLRDGEATRGAILDAITHFQETLNENDNLLIYYAGHGYAIRNPDGTYDKAYWLPVDATSNSSSNRIIADDLTTDIRLLPARHVLIISDSCYAGGLSREGTDAGMANPKPGLVEKMLAGRSRTLMASGGDEPVEDGGGSGHSVFAAALLKALGVVDAAQFTATDLFVNRIEPQVAKNAQQIPRYDPIRFHGNEDSGDFVFTRKVAGQELTAAQVAARQGITMLHDQPYAEAFRLLQGACDAGVGEGCRGLSYMYTESKAGDPPVMAMSMQGFVPTPSQANQDKAKALDQKGCDLGDSGSCTNLGILARYDWGHPDYAAAMSFFRRSCDGGDAKGCSELGLSFDSRMAGIYGSDPNSVDDKKAFELYRKGCDGGDVSGCNSEGFLYEAGKGVAKDWSKAKALYRIGCDQGDEFSCADLKRLGP